MSMYLCDAPCPSNEELAQRIQDGDPEAPSLLLSQNEGYLTMLAASYCEQFSQDFLVDDLKQEGALALLDADGAESDLPFTVEDEELSFTLDFTPVEDEEPVPIRLIRLIPIAE